MFAGFSSSDFDAYEPRKWKSNVFNRERMEVKQKLVDLGRVIESSLRDSDGAPLAVETSVEHPAHFNHKQVEAQHLYFSRNEGARKELDAILDREKTMTSLFDDPSPQRNHVFLAVTLRHGGLELALRLHPDAKIDRENFERKLADHFEGEKAEYLVRALDGYLVGVGESLRPTTDITTVELAAILGQLSATSTPGQAPALFEIVRRFSREEVSNAGTNLATDVARELERLLPLFHFVAWTRTNDFVLMREQLQKEKQHKAQRGLSRNDAVRIVRGIMSGKAGVVQEIDGKGTLRVLVGKMMVKLEADDVVKA